MNSAASEVRKAPRSNETSSPNRAKERLSMGRLAKFHRFKRPKVNILSEVKLPTLVSADWNFSKWAH
ncbi:MAG: hypothetical protein ACTS4V_01745 [Candidatus Hodgkinia cicadicola]